MNKVTQLKPKLKPLEKVICKTCKKPAYKNGTMDGICAPCWNQRPKLFSIKS